MSARLQETALALSLLAGAAGAQTTLFDLSGLPGSLFGLRLDTLGDLDGDGLGEFLVSAPYESNGSLAGAGAVNVHSGADGRVLFTVRGSGAGDHLGFGAGAAGDVNADGVPDFVVGAPDDNVPFYHDGGSVQVLSGRDGSVLHYFTGERVADFLGFSCEELGDLDGDGHDDVLIGAPGRIAPDGRWVGALIVRSGADGRVLVTAYGDRVGGLLGESNTCRVGDVDGDGRVDFLGEQLDNVRVVRVFSGADGRQLRRHSVVVPSGNLAVAANLDADADGIGDYLFGLNGGGPAGFGQVQVISGRDGSLLHEFLGERSTWGLGGSVAGVGDLDGDGHGDLVASAPYCDGPAGTQTGAVRAFSGRDGHVILTVHGDRPIQHFGLGSAGGGRDVNGDRYPDVLVSTLYGGVETVKVLSLVPRGLEPFGIGTPGCAGALTLLANSVPAVGNATFAVHLSRAGEDVTSLLAGDVADPAGTPLYNALFHLAPARVFARTQLPLPDVHRSIVAPLPIPPDPALLGLTYHFQGVSMFPAGTCSRRISTTPGLHLTFQ